MDSASHLIPVSIVTALIEAQPLMNEYFVQANALICKQLTSSSMYLTSTSLGLDHEPLMIRTDVWSTTNMRRPVASQPGGGGLNLDGWNTRRTPPLDIARVTSSIWKTPPLLDIHKHPPPLLDIARVTSSTYSKGGTKLLKGGTKLLKGGTKLLKGGTKLLKGGTKLLKGGTKLLKGGTKLLKGGTKSLGWATGGGVVRPPRPPLATGLMRLSFRWNVYI